MLTKNVLFLYLMDVPSMIFNNVLNLYVYDYQVALIPSCQSVSWPFLGVANRKLNSN